MWTGRNTVGKSNGHDDISLLGKNARFKGTIMFEGTARIDGRLEGDISTEGILVIGEDAVVEGNIAARAVHCAGTVTGDIVASEKVELVSPAFVTGRVKTPRLSLQEGVSFVGVSEVQNTAAALTVEVARDTPAVPHSPLPRKKLISWGAPANPASSSTAIGE
jgi:cytoskeletal protein CcmA (bactofilin family)